MNPRTLTWALGALALALTVALAVSLWHRQPATDTAQPAPRVVPGADHRWSHRSGDGAGGGERSDRAAQQ